MNPRWRNGLLAAGLVLLTIAAYHPASQGGFIWDDEAYVLENANLRTWEGLGRIWLEPRSSPQYYPLVFTSLWLDFQAHGLRPFGYHLVNILLHAAAALLAWRVLAALAVPGAWIAAALFAVHPVHVESVAWITERKNVLSGVFYLASALAYLRFAGKPARGRAAAYALSLLLFVAALLSKTVTCSLPAALALVLWWKRGRLAARDLLPLAPFFALGLAAGLTTAWLERVHVGALGAEWHLSFVDRALIAGRALAFYLGKLAWPHPLVFMYPRWDAIGAAWWYLFPAAILATVVLLWRRREAWGRGPLVAALFFGGTLFPALGFFNLYPMRYTFVADHYPYLASLGPLALAGAGLARLGGRSAASAAAAVLLAFGALTWNRGHVYRNAETLWRDTVAKNPASWMAHNNLGLLLAASGRVGEAIARYEAALALRPASPETLTNLGLALAVLGRADEGIARHRAALALDPDYADAWNNLGITLAQRGELAEGVRALGKAIALKPRFPDAYMNLGHAHLMAGRVAEAAESYRRALQLAPHSAEAANNLAWLMATVSDARVRDPGKAVLLAEWACTQSGYREAGHLDTLAAAYAAAGRFKEAVVIAERAQRTARGAGRERLAAEIDLRLRLYRENRAFTPPP